MTGEISAEESNFNSRQRERKKNAARGKLRNSGSPREFSHQIAVPTWLDLKYVAAYAEEHGISKAEARDAIYKRDY